MARRLDVDLTRSYARRTADGCRLVLGLPADGPAGDLRLTSRRGGTTDVPLQRGEAADDVVAAVAEVPELRAGTYRLALVDDGGEERRLDARLLNGPRQPIALLPGPKPTTRMAAPDPRPQPAPRPQVESAAPPAPTGARRAAAAVLQVLPEGPRARVHRVLGGLTGRRG